MHVPSVRLAAWSFTGTPRADCGAFSLGRAGGNRRSAVSTLPRRATRSAPRRCRSRCRRAAPRGRHRSRCRPDVRRGRRVSPGRRLRHLRHRRGDRLRPHRVSDRDGEHVPAARAQDAVDLGERGTRTPDVLHHVMGDHEVELTGRERQGHQVLAAHAVDMTTRLDIGEVRRADMDRHLAQVPLQHALVPGLVDAQRSEGGLLDQLREEARTVAAVAAHQRAGLTLIAEDRTAVGTDKPPRMCFVPRSKVPVRPQTQHDVLTERVWGSEVPAVGQQPSHQPKLGHRRSPQRSRMS